MHNNSYLAYLMYRRHSFKAGEYDLRHFGGCILEPPKHTVAIRDVEIVSSFGNPDDVIDHGRYKTVDFDIAVGFRRDLYSGSTAVQISEIKNWLSSLTDNYHYYSDSYNKGWHTRAVLTEVDPLVRTNVNLWETKLTFTRLPYWYSDSGAAEIPLIKNEDVILDNPSPLPSKPTIIWRYTPGASGMHRLWVNGTQVLMYGTSDDAEIRFECEAMRYISIKSNGTIVQVDDTLPPDLLPRGHQNVVRVTGAGDFSIIPNWRRL